MPARRMCTYSSRLWCRSQCESRWQHCSPQSACCQSLITAAQLLSHNADIEVKNKEDLTLLLLAISEKYNQMVEYLLTQGANAHALDKYKRTALMTAVDKFVLDIIIESLLQRMSILKKAL